MKHWFEAHLNLTVGLGILVLILLLSMFINWFLGPQELRKTKYGNPYYEQADYQDWQDEMR